MEKNEMTDKMKETLTKINAVLKTKFDRVGLFEQRSGSVDNTDWIDNSASVPITVSFALYYPATTLGVQFLVEVFERSKDKLPIGSPELNEMALEQFLDTVANPNNLISNTKKPEWIKECVKKYVNAVKLEIWRNVKQEGS